INLGGDIKVLGPHPDGSPWAIGIRHPRNPSEIARTVYLKSGAMASSGDYERCILLGGRRYGHVLNPKTGWPVSHLASVSVVAEFCVVAGSASTIAMLMEEQGPSWLDAMAHAWLVITDAAKILLHPYLLVILFLVAALCFLKLHTPLALRGLPLKGLWLQQLYAAAVGMVGLLLLAHAGPFLGWAWMYYAIALWLICCLCYVQRHQPSQATILGRLTHLAGVLMTISILPCVVKGVLAQYGL
ncbi:FAD:protein FMN transferase, partial [bacterium]|nr:FAD:protein FMN transferase [bacterium]